MTTFDTMGPIDLSVAIGSRADIWVTATGKAEASATITPRVASRPLDQRLAEEIEVSFVDGRLALRNKSWRRYVAFNDGGSVEITIEVPIGSSFDIETGVGDVTAGGEFGRATVKTGMGSVTIDYCTDLHVKTGFGDVVVARATGQVEIATGSGKLRVAEIEGVAQIKNGNGETVIGSLTGALTGKASNGDFTIERLGGDIDIKSSTGAVRVGDVTRGAITAATVAGGIDVGVHAGTPAWLDLSSKHSHVRNELAAAGAPVAGGDTVQVRARSSYGDITIHQSKAS